MSRNAPTFDPLNTTTEEHADLVAGYRDGFAGKPPRPDASLAYAYGRRNGVNDKAGTADPEQREVARRKLRADLNQSSGETPRS